MAVYGKTRKNDRRAAMMRTLDKNFINSRYVSPPL
jgi:hypothetical protein